MSFLYNTMFYEFYMSEIQLTCYFLFWSYLLVTNIPLSLCILAPMLFSVLIFSMSLFYWWWRYIRAHLYLLDISVVKTMLSENVFFI